METLTDKLSNVLRSFEYFHSEVILALGILVLILIDLVARVKYAVPFFAAVLAAVVLYIDFHGWAPTGGSVLLFHGMVTYDPASQAWKIILDLGTLLAIVVSMRSPAIREKAESYPLIFAILLGGHVLAMATNLLILYLSIEIISIASYALTIFAFDKKASEAAVKYLLFGAVASALMLYGMSWVYAFTGSLDFMTAEFADALLKADVIPLSIALVLVLVGFLFKIAAVPLHAWVPDVYTAAPTSVVAFFSIVPKLAGFSVLTKWFLVVNLFGLGPIPWVQVISAIAVLTLLIGNFAALRQNHVKRLLAYSSIAHSGFLLVPVVSLSEQATKNLYFYAVVYIFMNLGIFAIVQYLENREGITKASEYKGLVKRYPLLTVLVVMLMISLAGLPPTAGFTAKLLIFSSLWDAYGQVQDPWLLYLFIFGLLNTVVSLFYYLKIPFFMIFRNREEFQPVDPQKHLAWENYFAFTMVLALVALFFKPEWLMNIMNNISFAF
ncbi:MAG: NADH-quinone oxidoreductase subunit N [Cytophagales bacterium]|nr:NADH-quinone oxidoreductase subunit N [Cytophagales bacterium]